MGARQTYVESPTSGWHAEETRDLHGVSHTHCKRVFLLKTEKVETDRFNGLCVECLHIVHPSEIVPQTDYNGDYWD